MMAELGVTLGSADIPIQTSPDINSPDRAPLAHAVVETLHLDMHQVSAACPWTGSVDGQLFASH